MLRVVPCGCASLQTQRLRPTGGRKTPGLSECSLQYCLHSLFLSSGLHMSQFTDKGTPLPSAPLPPGAARPGVSCGVKLLGCPQSETNPPTQQRRLLPDPRLMAPPEAERFPAALDPSHFQGGQCHFCSRAELWQMLGCHWRQNPHGLCASAESEEKHSWHSCRPVLSASLGLRRHASVTGQRLGHG